MGQFLNAAPRLYAVLAPEYKQGPNHYLRTILDSMPSSCADRKKQWLDKLHESEWARQPPPWSAELLLEMV